MSPGSHEAAASHSAATDPHGTAMLSRLMCCSEGSAATMVNDVGYGDDILRDWKLALAPGVRLAPILAPRSRMGVAPL